VGLMSLRTANSRGTLHTRRLLMASRPRAEVLQHAHTATALRRLDRKLGVYDTPPEGCSASMNKYLREGKGTGPYHSLRLLLDVQYETVIV
jgi:hypothetical protein